MANGRKGIELIPVVGVGVTAVYVIVRFLNKNGNTNYSAFCEEDKSGIARFLGTFDRKDQCDDFVASDMEANGLERVVDNVSNFIGNLPPELQLLGGIVLALLIAAAVIGVLSMANRRLALG